MNDTIRLTPEVDGFVAAVRARFADLGADEREDLLDGLEADMADLVAERGPEALGDPDAYADELRSAAGLAPPMPPGRRGLGRVLVPMSSLTIGRARARFDAAIATRSWAASVMGFLSAVRPAWWVLRAWLVVQTVDAMLGPWEEMTLVPSLMIPGAGLVLLAVALVVSVQVGRGAWPSDRLLAPVHRRRLLLVGNLGVLAVALPVTLGQAENEMWGNGYGYSMASASTSGVTNHGREVCNLQAYDVTGQPVVGVQLFDDHGRPFDVRCPDRWGKGAYPWYLGDVARWNVFPQAERRQRTVDRVVDGAYESTRPPAFPVTDRATVPAVTHPLVPVVVDEPAEEPVDKSGEKSGKPKGKKSETKKPADAKRGR